MEELFEKFLMNGQRTAAKTKTRPEKTTFCNFGGTDAAVSAASSVFAKAEKTVAALKEETLLTLFDLDYQNDVVFFDSYGASNEVLQFSAQNATSSLQLWGEPFDQADVQNRADAHRRLFFHNNEFVSRRKKCSSQKGPFSFFRDTKSVVSNDIRPENFTRWLANNTEGVVILVGTWMSRVFDCRPGGRLFLNRCLQTVPLKSEDGAPLTLCYLCAAVATFVTAESSDATDGPLSRARFLLCTRHARSTALPLALYLPVLVEVVVTSMEIRLQLFDCPTPFKRTLPELSYLNSDRSFTTLLTVEHGAPFIPGKKVMPRVHAHISNHRCYHVPAKILKYGALNSVDTLRCLVRFVACEAIGSLEDSDDGEEGVEGDTSRMTTRDDDGLRGRQICAKRSNDTRSLATPATGSSNDVGWEKSDSWIKKVKLP